ncbi:MAG: hypothetical protein ACRCZP_14270 [Phycicoccus sp.]
MPGDLDGVPELLAGIARQSNRVTTVSPRALTNVANWVEARAKQLLSLTSHQAGTPTPSQPGQPPSLISGALRRSIAVLPPTQTGENEWSITVGPTIVYGRIQELGGQAGRGRRSNLPARPYMAPAWAAVPDRLRGRLEAVWQRALDT